MVADNERQLMEPMAALCYALRGLRDQVEQLATVHTAIDAFNVEFGNFQYAMGLHGSCLRFPPPARRPPPPAPTAPVQANAATPPYTANKPPQPTGIPLPQTMVPPSITMQNTAQSAEKARANGNGMSASKNAALQRRRQPLGKHGKKRPTPNANSGRPTSWKWDKSTAQQQEESQCGETDAVFVADIRDQIPRKYQSEQELKKLETILLYLKNRNTGM